jgi:hypothetical protein
MHYLSHDLTTPFMQLYPAIFQGLLASHGSDGSEGGTLDIETIVTIAVETTKAAIAAASDRSCHRCRHFEIDTGDESVGMQGGGPMCLLDESDQVIDTESFPSPAIFCPFFQLPVEDLEH